MDHFKLASYKYKHGVLVSPWNEMCTPLGDDLSWFKGRLPEYLWIALILDSCERQVALNKSLFMMERLLKICPSMPAPAWSEILKLPDAAQKHFFEYISASFGKEVLSPLTSITSLLDSQVFVSVFQSQDSITDKLDKVISVLNETSDHQSNKATDVRYLVLSYCVISGKYKLQQEHVIMLDNYRILPHEDEEMRALRPFVRASEMVILNEFNKLDNSRYLNKFWDIISQATDCKCFTISYQEEQMDNDELMDQFQNIFSYY